MIIGPQDIRKMNDELRKARELAGSMTVKDALARLGDEKPDLLPHYIAHIEEAGKQGKNTAINPWIWRVGWKWRQVALDSENCGLSTQDFLDRISKILLVPSVDKRTGKIIPLGGGADGENGNEPE